MVESFFGKPNSLLILELQPGELLLFPNSLIHHSNEQVTHEIRHSVVAFTPNNMLAWFSRTYGREKDRDVELRARRATVKKRKAEAGKQK